jgi:hypothetical protein
VMDRQLPRGMSFTSKEPDIFYLLKFVHMETYVFVKSGKIILRDAMQRRKS